MPETMLYSIGYNLLLIVIAFVVYRLLLRASNKLMGYTVSEFIQECRHNGQYQAIANYFAYQSLAAAILVGLVIS